MDYRQVYFDRMRESERESRRMLECLAKIGTPEERMLPSGDSFDARMAVHCAKNAVHEYHSAVAILDASLDQKVRS